MLRVARQLVEFVARNAAPEIIAGHIFDLVRFIENHRAVFRQDCAEIILADGQVREEQMMIDDNHVRFVRPLVHCGDEAILEFGALLAGAGIAPRVEPMPQIGVIGQKIQLSAIASLRQFLPVANLREPVHLIHALQHLLSGHHMHFVPAEKIVSPLHQRHFQFRRKMFLQEGNVLVEELLLERFRGRGNHHAPPAAYCRQKIRERFPGSSARFDQRMLVLGKSFLDNFRHLELAAPEFEGLVALRQQSAIAENIGHGDIFRCSIFRALGHWTHGFFCRGPPKTLR